MSSVFVVLLLVTQPQSDVAIQQTQELVEAVSTSTSPEVFDASVESRDSASGTASRALETAQGRVLGYLRPDAKAVLRALASAEANRAEASCPLTLADALVRAEVKYRPDGALEVFSRSQLPRALSCSEFVYWMFAACGAQLGSVHVRTKSMAYGQEPVYPLAFKRLPETTAPVAGDLLVYHYEQAEVPKRPPGHVVLVVSGSERLVVGSHGNKSTPQGKRTGVGYRRVVDWLQWTDGRRLRAVFRPLAHDAGSPR